MADETTDIAIIKEVIVYAWFLGKDRRIRTAFIAMIGIPDSCAISIMGVLQKLCEDNQLDLEHKHLAVMELQSW